MLLDYWLYNQYNITEMEKGVKFMEYSENDFLVPFYIFEEIIEYIELTAKGNCKCMKWENIKSLINLAVVNNRITQEQANFLKENFCRE